MSEWNAFRARMEILPPARNDLIAAVTRVRDLPPVPRVRRELGGGAP